jgi:ankyrin repeat protein
MYVFRTLHALAAEEDGRTALEGAAEHGRANIVQLLLAQMSCVTDIQRENIAAASHRAEENGDLAIRHFIEARLEDGYLVSY